MDYSLILAYHSINWWNGNATKRQKKRIQHSEGSIWNNTTQSPLLDKLITGTWWGCAVRFTCEAMTSMKNYFFLPLKTTTVADFKISNLTAYWVWLESNQCSVYTGSCTREQLITTSSQFPLPHYPVLKSYISSKCFSCSASREHLNSTGPLHV